MTITELRTKYLEFFQSKGHAIIPSASLIPENDATVLFTTAGMHPLVPYLMGEKHPAGTRLADCQKCIRTSDIDDVGDNSHLTFFEMLGNWSLGDYFKNDSIAWSWEFLTEKQWLGIDPKMISVTVFEGDNNAPRDEESAEIWKSLGVLADKIAFLPAEDNWWAAGPTGPCGPDTEIFYWVGEGLPPEGSNKGTDSANWMEIWNNVFMQYNRVDENTLKPLPAPCVDTGMGMERTVTVLNNAKEVYSLVEFQEIFNQIEKLSNKKYEDNKKAFRIIADHIRCATMILGDDKGIEPSNVDQGYILRRLIRRAVRYGKQLGIEQSFCSSISSLIINQMKDVYSELETNKQFIFDQLNKEEEKFALTLERGLKRFSELTSLDAKIAFDLFQSYGFPLEMTQELALEKGWKVDLVGFNEEMKKHQDLSRAGAEQKFKGGLADTSDDTRKLHTATHLLQAALQKTLGEHVHQKGSNITPERLRFDFVHPEKMTPEQLATVENLVNEWIMADYEVKCEELSYDEAKARGAMGLFTDKYGAIVKLYTIGDVSCEMCGGPHATQTSELGKFKIIKEEASSSGVRRIKAILE